MSEMEEKVLKISKIFIKISILMIVFFVPIYFSFLENSFNIFELNKLVLFRIFLTLGMLAWAIRVMFAQKIKYRFNNIIFLFLAGIIGSQLISSILSIHPFKSFWGDYLRQQGFFSFLFYYFFFLFLLFNVKRLKEIKNILSTVLLSSFLVVVYGLAQFFSIDPIKWQEPFYLTGRMFSTLGQPNFLAHFLILVIPLSIYFLFFISRKLISRLIVFILLILQFFCLIYTSSRAAWLGIIASFLFLAIFFSFTKKKIIGWAIVVFIVLFSFSLVLANNQGVFDEFSKESVVGRFKTSFDVRAGSANIRLKYFKAGIDEFRQASLKRKIFGYGPDTLASVFIKHYEPSWGTRERINLWPDRSHNFLLDYLLHFGILSFLLSLSFFIYLAFIISKYLKNKEKDPEYWLVLSCICSFVSHFVYSFFSFSATTHFVYFYLILAILLIIIFKDHKTKEFSFKLNKYFKGLIIILFALLSLIFIFYYNINMIRADNNIQNAKKYIADKNCWGSLYFAQNAINLNFSNTFYKKGYIDIASACIGSLFSVEAADNLRESIILYNESVPAKERDYSLDLSYAFAESVFATTLWEDQYDSAVLSFEKMLEKYPQVDTLYINFANLKIKKGDFDDAIDILNKGLLIMPDLSDPYFVANHKVVAKRDYAYFYNLLAKAYEGKGDDGKAQYYQDLENLLYQKVNVY